MNAQGVRRMPTGLWTWIGPLLVTLLGGGVRFWRLGEPNAVVFDETYYVKDSYSLLQYGHERAYVDKADEKLLAGTTELFTDSATFVVHPPVGKWIIAAGEKVGGLDAFGWRLGVALVGTLMIFLLARIAMRMTGSIVLGCLAGLLLALDGLAVVMSRTALLDGILAFFLLGAFGALLVDRDHVRERLATHAPGRAEGADTSPIATALASSTEPRFGARPWRLLAGLCLGLAVGTKWSALPYIAAFGLLAVIWDAGARRAAGAVHPWISMLRRDAAAAFSSLVVLAAGVYLISWSGWLFSGRGWSRQWASGRDSMFGFIPDPLRSLWHYHSEIITFHTKLTQDHPYESSPWGWTILARPVAYYSQGSGAGEVGCDAEDCISEVLGIGTPVLWWAATAALAYMVWRWAGARDWRAGAILAGVAAGWLPWFRYEDRPIFYFYAIAFLPFLILGLTLAIGALIGPALTPEAPRRARRRRTVGTWVAGGLVVAVVLNFFFLYPVLTADTLPRGEWMQRMWFRSWI